ncbi:hypothetical protein [Nocardia wallacei]|uniref:hypothetical protein n=1 Tax=Nocardia wallacei TaxID=480035 RepID=UPI0024559399|nr:hypothetical protein [Nocardia wallacei]
MRPTLTVTVLGGLLVGITALAAPASAATPQEVCGSGYTTVNSMPVGGSLGTVYLTYNRTNGRNCVATIRNSTGKAMDMSAWIEIPDTGSAVQDSGEYTSHAGPVYAFGRGHCVNWGGNIDNRYVQIDNSNCAAHEESRHSFTR